MKKKENVGNCSECMQLYEQRSTGGKALVSEH
jgi:hypothetical protein